MKSHIIIQNPKAGEKRKYNRPEIKVIKIDNDISLVMMSANPGDDPTESIQSEHFSINPFKMPKL
jgi:hypothetical protein